MRALLIVSVLAASAVAHAEEENPNCSIDAKKCAIAVAAAALSVGAVETAKVGIVSVELGAPPMAAAAIGVGAGLVSGAVAGAAAASIACKEHCDADNSDKTESKKGGN